MVVLGFGAMKAYQYFSYGGTTYYTKITNTGKESKGDQGDTQYEYQLTGYDDKGNARKLKFSAFHRDKPLKLNAYLQVTYNKSRGVTRWQSIPEAKIPDAAKEKLK